MEYYNTSVVYFDYYYAYLGQLRRTVVFDITYKVYILNQVTAVSTIYNHLYLNTDDYILYILFSIYYILYIIYSYIGNYNLQISIHIFIS